MQRANHVHYDIKYHIVWMVDEEFGVLDGDIAKRVRELIRYGCDALGVSIVKGGVGKNYVHIFVSCPPNVSVSKLVQRLKGKTSRFVLNESNDDAKKHLWESGYFCVSVGNVNEKMIRDYFGNVDNDTFKILG